MGTDDHSLHELIRGCIDRDLQLMEQFYHRFAPEMWVVCLRYAKSAMMAEDVMQEGFIRAFDTMAGYSGTGSFHGWLRRVFVTTALNHLKRYHRYEKVEHQVDQVYHLDNRDRVDAVSRMQADQLMELISLLPDGARAVFNLYVIEGYSHREISELLGFSEANSRSQLYRARLLMQQALEQIDLYNESYCKKRNSNQISDKHHGAKNR